ncbi:sensor histidine kinase [Paenibacillus sp. MY03]|uniref:sensor histidine kinase n=1 Tax=Paenibacillus sp. MY03 TaxID=302980 RepID=UPI0015C630E6|nr:histidine kinase [Paenibacillus sp. MY03]
MNKQTVPLPSSRSLKNRLVLFFTIMVLAPLVSILILYLSNVYPLLNQRIENEIQNNLKQFATSLQGTLESLNYATQRFAFADSVGSKLGEWLTSDDLYEKSKLTREITSELNLISITNPVIGLTFYYDESSESLVFAMPQVREFRLDELPVMSKTSSITYFRPHRSLDRFNHRNVLSVIRRVDLPDNKHVMIYAETSYNFMQNILETDRTNRPHLIVDDTGVVIYSEEEKAFPPGSRLALGGTKKVRSAGYYLFHEPTYTGWRVVSLVPSGTYHKEINRWLLQLGVILLLSLVVGLILARVIWRMVYDPLRRINNGFQLVGTGDLSTPIASTRIVEFDQLLRHFEKMRLRIRQLLEDNAIKERRRADFETEKLLYQINPHFIHNTLDTIRWLARVKGNHEIDELASSLNKLLYYNLGKKGHMSTVAEEIEALQDYIALQRVRYDFEFQVSVLAEPEVLQFAIPRFILQPLVENSLYHGNLGENGVITVTIGRLSGESVFTITVRDNGAGMTQPKLDMLMQDGLGTDGKIGLGIGTYYVRKVLENQFGQSADFGIESVEGEGTCVYLKLPIRQEGT